MKISTRPPAQRRPEHERPARYAGRPGFVYGRDGYMHNRVWIRRAGLGCCPPMGFPQ